MYRAPVLFCLAMLISPVSGHGGDEIRLLFTSNSNGKYENCQCPDNRYGALERRAQFIEQYMSKYPDTIVLDNGDNFFSGMRDEEKSLVTRIFTLIPYDYINIGDQDIAFGPEGYFDLPQIVRERGKPIPVRRGETQISVLPVTHPATTRFYPEGTFTKQPFDEPLPQIEKWMQDIAGKNLIPILLSHSGYDRDVEYAQRFPDIRLIIGGHSQTVVDSLNMVNGVAVLQAGGNGEYIGEIILGDYGSDFRILSYRLHPMDKSVGAVQQIINWIEDYHKTYPRR